MRILGIDTGKNHIGIALYNTTIHNITYFEEHACIDYSSYFQYFQNLVRKLLDSGSLDVIIFEKPFFTVQTLGKNTKTLEIIGIQKLVSEIYKIPYDVLSPKTVKKVVTGNGNACKEDVIKSVNDKFSLEINVSHVADAVAIAYAYYLRNL